MITPLGDPKVIEFNCRFGDPETQPIMMRLNSDLAELCLAAIEGKLDQTDADWLEEAAIGVVLAAEGYPGSYPKGAVISGLDEINAPCKVFHAGTQIQDEQVVTSGGRVLCVTAYGTDIAKAQQQAYAEVKKISWPGMQFRSDIGYRAINRKS
jgi:phosphoribosylamine--glycine ligase